MTSNHLLGIQCCHTLCMNQQHWNSRTDVCWPLPDQQQNIDAAHAAQVLVFASADNAAE